MLIGPCLGDGRSQPVHEEGALRDHGQENLVRLLAAEAHQGLERVLGDVHHHLVCEPGRREAGTRARDTMNLSGRGVVRLGIHTPASPQRTADQRFETNTAVTTKKPSETQNW